jgi:hypothetical protein
MKQNEYIEISNENYRLNKDLFSKTLEQIVEEVTMKLDTISAGQDIEVLVWRYIDKKNLSEEEIEQIYSYYLLVCGKHWYEE